MTHAFTFAVFCWPRLWRALRPDSTETLTIDTKQLNKLSPFHFSALNRPPRGPPPPFCPPRRPRRPQTLPRCGLTCGGSPPCDWGGERSASTEPSHWQAIRGYTTPPLAGKTAPDCGGKSIELTKNNRSALPTDRTLRCFLERSDNTFSSASTSVSPPNGQSKVRRQHGLHAPSRPSDLGADTHVA